MQPKTVGTRTIARSSGIQILKCKLGQMLSCSRLDVEKVPGRPWWTTPGVVEVCNHPLQPSGLAAGYGGIYFTHCVLNLVIPRWRCQRNTEGSLVLKALSGFKSFNVECCTVLSIMNTLNSNIKVFTSSKLYLGYCPLSVFSLNPTECLKNVHLGLVQLQQEKSVRLL